MTSHAEDLDRYLQIIAGATPAGALIEIRSTTPHGAMRQTFTPATRPDLAARAITRLAARADVYIGVLLRRRRLGGRHACEPSHLAFVEIDQPDALDRLERYRCPPSMVIASGGTPGHAHAYWQLRQPVDLDALENANRRLAHHLGGDLACVDAARILRPPTSWNRKRTPPARVELLILELARRYPLAQLTAGLTDPSPPRRQSPSRPGRVAGSELDQQLLAIPAATYVHALIGRQPNRAGKIRCPWHDDQNPSLQLYDDGTWYCYGACRTGGSVYDFASRWWGLDTRGHQFLALRQRLAQELHVTPAGAATAADVSARTALSESRA